MTINILKTWANIGENYLGSNLEYTKDISQKISLDQALQKSITLLPTDIQDLTDILPAIYEINRRVKFPLDSLPVLMALNNLFKELATKLIDNYSYRELKKYLVPDSSQKDSHYSLLCKLREENYKQIINSKNNHKGVIYRIENQKGYSSYLIGTIHDSAKLLDNTKIPEIVQNSSDFFSEIGELALNETSDVIDEKLTVIASANNIPIHALETLEELSDINTKVTEQYHSLIKDNIEKKKALKLKKLTERGQLEKYNEYSADNYLFKFDMLSNWKKGDIESIKSDYKVFRAFAISNAKTEIVIQEAKHRNYHWLFNKNLLTKLENTEKPISIAVGLCHLFGKAGLLKAFEDKGLKIEQI